jgi:transposase-like protein
MGGMKQVQAPVSRQRFTARQRSELLAQFESCGLSVADFATQHGIGTSTLFSWLRQRRRRPGRAANQSKLPSSPFQEISLPSSLAAPGPWAGEVQLPDGTHLRWSSQTTPALLQELLAHLRASC